ncbi:hypothetical protein HQ524_04275 [Candidatus Uhrbacteria bacterium]|nr:hypothetical protein [Candidatus Uhrbacteria bacterium]
MGNGSCSSPTQEDRDSEISNMQQAQYAKGQPVPVYDWSLERELLIQLYNIRNSRVSTHSVWRSDYGMVEGDCPSMGYGLPYDTSLTNPWQAEEGNWRESITSIGQAEPNGVFASTNTSATWVMCVGTSGSLEPVYVESKVTVFPGPVVVNYETNRVNRSGKASVIMKKPEAPK